MSKLSGMTPAALNALLSGDHGNFMAASLPGGIEAQEKAGQDSFVSNSTLPIQMSAEAREGLEKAGVVFGDPVDKLFLSVKLPEGWKKLASDHSMWSHLLDEKDRKRAAIFYKAAFYDMSANLSLCCRYNLEAYSPVDKDGNPVKSYNGHHLISVRDGETIIHRVGIYADRDYATKERLVNEAEAWLKENFPLWEDATAYWD